MLTYEAACSAPARASVAVPARPALWPRWAPHLRGAWGLGDPEVELGARGAVRLLGVVPIPARIVAKEPEPLVDVARRARRRSCTASSRRPAAASVGRGRPHGAGAGRGGAARDLRAGDRAAAQEPGTGGCRDRADLRGGGIASRAALRDVAAAPVRRWRGTASAAPASFSAASASASWLADSDSSARPGG